MATAFVWHERMMWHDTGNAVGVMPHGSRFQPGLHYEDPETKRRLKNLLDGYGISERLVMVTPREASDEDILRVHSLDYLDRLRRLDRTGGNASSDSADSAIMAAGGLGIARLSAGGAIAAIEAVAQDRARNAYAMTRPPGHHAQADGGMGSCLLANIAIGVRALQARGALGRVAVVDWDVHHGNGTEAIFFDDPSVLTISIHQDRLYPAATGGIDSRGKGAGEGFNINVPLPPGSGRAAYLRTMEKIVLPALARFAPDFIICACGFDASALDPLGRMLLTSADFGAMTAMLMDAARQYCGDRLVLCHEGGYSATYVPFCGAAVIETLLGGPSAVEDPILPAFAAYAQDPIAAHQLGAVEAARAAARL